MPDVSRIKRNVAKMVQQGAPETDIDAYIASEGATLDQVQAAPLTDPNELEYRGRLLPFGRTKGGNIRPAVPGFIQDILDAGQTVGDVYSGRTPAMVPDTGQGVTNPDVESAAKTIGAIASPVNPAFRAGDLAIPGMMRAPLRKEMPTVPTRQELRGAYKTGKKQAVALGVDYHVSPVIQMVSTIRAELEKEGINSVTAPKTIQLLDKAASPAPGVGASLEGLITARKSFRNAAKDFSNPTEQLAASHVIQALDRFAEAPPAQSVVAGPAAFGQARQSATNRPFSFQPSPSRGLMSDEQFRQSLAGHAQQIAEDRARQAGDLMSDANANYAAGMRSKRFDKQRRAAELDAGASYSGMNIDNTLRQKVNIILKSEKLSAGFTPAEIKEMELFSAGKTHSRNVRRYIGNLLGGGGGLGANVTSAVGSGLAGALGFKLAGPMGIAASTIPPAIGFGLKTSANNAARRGMDELDAMIRKRSPLFDQRLALSPSAPLTAEARAAALRAMGIMAPRTLTIGGDQNGFLTPEEQAAQRRRLAGGGPRL